ncbi:helix-turn-helix domain-containing protein [Actinophytocola gossypii]|uniref:helix-turn-helix domain-containing protein n=1 Tax=Actinophytocola gossypii TaxID=2812003 RepID=UPI0021A6B591|nr:helix-turn-helix transcriptional regulator [Actinophytocola gossypii]
MNTAEGPAIELARRLRSLRERTWSGQRLTQGDLAKALDASVPLISSWESTKNPKVPPLARLEDYARFFAVERKDKDAPYELPTRLTDEEQTRADELLEELAALSNAARADIARSNAAQPDRSAAEPPFGGIWRFEANQDVTIVASELPADYLERMPYTDAQAPDYVDLYRYADLDALMELFAHIRAANPRNKVRFCTPAEMRTDDLTSHLVLLGGTDWNRVTKELLRRLDLPVHQMSRNTEDEPAGFEVLDGGERRLITPVLRSIGGRDVLDADVGHFYRAPNPYNAKRTVTICNGQYQRGTYGAVRALTDSKFRDRNDEYLRTRFAGRTTFSVVSRVYVVNHKVITPDWTDPETRLHEWPLHDSEPDRAHPPKA